MNTAAWRMMNNGKTESNEEGSEMNTEYTVKNPGRGTGYRLPLNNDRIRLQKTSYGDAIYGELTDTIGKMETIMKLENWKTMLDTVPVQEWPAYIEKSRSAHN